MLHDFDVPSNWYEDFFSPAVNRFWEAMVPPAATAADLAFIARHVGEPPARLLDMPCGAGRHALGLADMGYEVTGLDLSRDAIDRAAAAAGDLPVRFLLGDMREPPGGAFDAALCLGNSLGYFDGEGMAALFAALAAAVRPGGRLLLDTGVCAESIFPLVRDREIAFDGGSYRSRYAYDALRSVLKTDAELVLEGATHRLLYAHHIVTSGALAGSLGAAGFTTLALFADTDDTPYAPGSPRLLLLAQRE
jgi:SAM-dependent methyltransferase